MRTVHVRQALLHHFSRRQDLSGAAALEKAAYDLGFESVASGPLVRSSYHADQNLPEAKRAESLIA
jgi:lipoate synthase